MYRIRTGPSTEDPLIWMRSASYHWKILHSDFPQAVCHSCGIAHNSVYYGSLHLLPIKRRVPTEVLANLGRSLCATLLFLGPLESLQDDAAALRGLRGAARGPAWLPEPWPKKRFFEEPLGVATRVAGGSSCPPSGYLCLVRKELL